MLSLRDDTIIFWYTPYCPIPYLVAEFHHSIDAVEGCLGPGENKVGEDVEEVEWRVLTMEEEQGSLYFLWLLYSNDKALAEAKYASRVLDLGKLHHFLF